MKKSVLIFLIAVLLPSGLLGWLALQSAREQQIVLELRTAELYQSETDNAATAVRSLIEEQRRAFSETVRQLLATRSPRELAGSFAPALSSAWRRNAVGFSLGADGRLLSPMPAEAETHPDWKRFLRENGDFLSNRQSADVYWVALDDLNRPEALRKGSVPEASVLTGVASLVGSKRESSIEKALAKSEVAESRRLETKSVALQRQAPVSQLAKPSEAPMVAEAKALDKVLGVSGGAPAMMSKAKASKENPEVASRAKDVSGAVPPGAVPPMPANPVPQASAARAMPAMAAVADSKSAPMPMTRNVAPQQLIAANERAVYSQLIPATTAFRALTEGSSEGMITRFVQDRPELILWMRPPQTPELVFGCVIDAANLSDLWAEAFPASGYGGRGSGEFLMALLDDKARPVVGMKHAASIPDWKRPFVATEIGEVLPHWEAVLYLARPEQLSENARTVRRTFYLLVATALAAITSGGWLVFADARRQVLLAQKKADFVSNVSHELKTPLTSIRMFAEMMLGGRTDPERRTQYLRIILVEAERLTRLINNVLDFARLDRNRAPHPQSRLDFHELVSGLWERQELHLQENGFQTRWQAEPGPYWIMGDADALSQILINLLSNAEKYSGPQKEIELHTNLDGNWVCASVLDRGGGVPPGEEGRIFEPFYRAHDSLSSGIQGSGLGLTLARRHANEHGGDITYQSRAGGGSVFTLRLPLALFVTA